ADADAAAARLARLGVSLVLRHVLGAERNLAAARDRHRRVVGDGRLGVGEPDVDRHGAGDAGRRAARPGDRLGAEAVLPVAFDVGHGGAHLEAARGHGGMADPRLVRDVGDVDRHADADARAAIAGAAFLARAAVGLHGGVRVVLGLDRQGLARHERAAVGDIGPRGGVDHAHADGAGDLHVAARGARRGAARAARRAAAGAGLVGAAVGEALLVRDLVVDPAAGAARRRALAAGHARLRLRVVR